MECPKPGKYSMASCPNACIKNRLLETCGCTSRGFLTGALEEDYDGIEFCPQPGNASYANCPWWSYVKDTLKNVDTLCKPECDKMEYKV